MAAAEPKMAKKKFGVAGVLLALWVASFVVAAATETTAEQKATDGALVSDNNSNADDATSGDNAIAKAVALVADQIAAATAARRDKHAEDVLEAANKSLKQMDAAEEKAKKYKHASYGLAGVAGLGSLAGLFAAINTARKAGSEAPLSKGAKGAGIAAAITALMGLGGAVFSTIQKKKQEDKMRARARHLLLLREVLAGRARERAEEAARRYRKFSAAAKRDDVSRDDDEVDRLAAEMEEAQEEEAALWKEAKRLVGAGVKAGMYIPFLRGEPTKKGWKSF